MCLLARDTKLQTELKCLSELLLGGICTRWSTIQMYHTTHETWEVTGLYAAPQNSSCRASWNWLFSSTRPFLCSYSKPMTWHNNDPLFCNFNLTVWSDTKKPTLIVLWQLPHSLHQFAQEWFHASSCTSAHAVTPPLLNYDLGAHYSFSEVVANYILASAKILIWSHHLACLTGTENNGEYVVSWLLISYEGTSNIMHRLKIKPVTH